MNISNTLKENNFRFSYKNRIKKRSEFIRVQESGKKFHTPHFIIFILPSLDDYSKFGITVSKKVDKRATIRNKLKRRLREFFRLNKNKLSCNIKLVVIAKNNSANINFHDIRKELSLLLYKNKFFSNTESK